MLPSKMDALDLVEYGLKSDFLSYSYCPSEDRNCWYWRGNDCILVSLTFKELMKKVEAHYKEKNDAGKR